MQIDRRTFVKLGSAALHPFGQVGRFPARSVVQQQQAESQIGQNAPHGVGQAQWIWFPGQLAAYRHKRRMLRAVERCCNVGYPGNFRQPMSEMYFRRSGTLVQQTEATWIVPEGRTRILINGAGRDLATRKAMLPAGAVTIEIHTDFANSLPCLLFEAGELSSGAAWEVSGDGKSWTIPETLIADRSALPDAEKESIVSLPVKRTVPDQPNVQGRYSVKAGSGIILDFVETELGSLTFQASGTGTLRVQVGESLPEVGDPDPSQFEQYAIEPYALHGSPQIFTLPERAFRYARLSCSGNALVSAVRFQAKVWPVQTQASFQSSDEDLNAIWRAAVATLRSNMHDFYLDGIRRDALLWHDGPLTLEAYERVFADQGLSRQTLIGETLPKQPTTDDLGILDGPMYDVIAFEREYLLRGDPEFSRLFRDRIGDILAFYESLADRDGFISGASVQPYGFFPDWSATSQAAPDPHGIPAYAQMLLHGAYLSAARLAGAWGDAQRETLLQNKAQQLKSAIHARFWDASQGLFVNGLKKDGTLDMRVSSFAQAFAVAYDVAREQDYGSIFTFLEDAKRRSAHYSLSQVVEFRAFAQTGHTGALLTRLKQAWLPFLQGGFQRFPEDIVAGEPAQEQLGIYGRKYTASLCHAWAGAAPVLAISRGVLGVEALEPGYKVCKVEPMPCALKSFQGSVPTPHGMIVVSWNGSEARLTLPGGVAARTLHGSTHYGPGTFHVPART